MHYLYIRDVYSSKIYHLSVYDTTYRALGHTHPVTVTAAENSWYIPPKKGMKLENNDLLTLPSIHTLKFIGDSWNISSWRRIDKLGHGQMW